VKDSELRKALSEIDDSEEFETTSWESKLSRMFCFVTMGRCLLANERYVMRRLKSICLADKCKIGCFQLELASSE